jgi:hypothetical protein
MHDGRSLLVPTIHMAEEQLSLAEASLLLVEARVNLTDAAMARLRRLATALGLPVAPSPAPKPRTNISMKTLAEMSGVSERTCAKIRKSMVEGVHFHKVGERRIVFHDPDALLFVENWTAKPSAAVEGLAITNDVLRRRAKLALARAR